MSLAPGVRLGPYEILSAIGAGGMGEVYRARETTLRRDVAVKVLPADLSGDVVRLARFESEARLASSLNHPNIVTIYSVGEAGGTHYIAMELIQGQTLAQIIGRRPMEPIQMLDVASQVADGLAKAHQAGIVHRDLKPGNVMVTPDGLVKILDFGISKLARGWNDEGATTDTTGSAPTTGPNEIVGTIDYMSPEQATGQRVDSRSDQFSFGTMLYEMSCGRHPFHRATPVKTLAAIVSEEPELLNRVNPALPDGFCALTERCLMKDPARRYESIGDLSDDLHAVRRSLDRPARVHWSRSKTIAATIALLAILGAGIGVSRWRSPDPSSTLANLRQEVAVLPFTNVGGDSAGQALSDGIVETLTTQLTQLERPQGHFWIVPASEIRRDRVSSVRQARAAFAATLVVTGSVQRTDDHLRLTANLVDARTERQISARTIDIAERDIAAIQDRVVTQVIALLGFEPTPEIRAQATAGGTDVPGANEYYLQGRGYLQRFERPENVETAIELFNQALETDPNFALAHAGRAEAFWRRYESTRDPAFVQLARDGCKAALALNDRLSQVRVTLGIVSRGTGEYESAVRELQRALEIDPVSGDALRELAKTYEALGDFVQAETSYRQAIRVRPTDWTNYNLLGGFYFGRGRYADAAQAFQQVIRLTPDNARGYSNLGGAMAQLQRFDEATAAFRKSLELRPSGVAHSNLGFIFFRQERYTEAAREFEKATKMGVTDYPRLAEPRVVVLLGARRALQGGRRVQEGRRTC